MIFSRRNGYQPIGSSARTSTDSSPSTSDYGPLLENGEEKFHSRSKRRGCSGPLRYSSRLGKKLLWWILQILAVAIFVVLLLLIITPTIFPSYTHRPPHYKTLRSNPNNEKVFIAADIVNEELIRGAWGNALLELVDIIGHENTFVSIYENDSGPETKAALEELSAKIKSPHAVVSGHIDLPNFKTIQILPNQHRVKRIEYLAAVRNHALDPLPTNGTMQFDRLLFLNDIVFSPKDAADLLFSTNLGPDGRANYQAACAIDFINSFKFYDRFALRDNEAYRVGLPFFPFFTHAGKAESYKAIMRQSDAVPVKSCWGGMVAFEAKWFQQKQSPLKFRAEPDNFWDASECCLIHADLDEMVRQSSHNKTAHANIFVNPYVRVGYNTRAFAWLEFTRRFERLYPIPHRIISHLLGMPKGTTHDRRLEAPGERVNRRTWTYTGPAEDDGNNATIADISKYGRWETKKITASPGGFCGSDSLLVLKTHFSPGERMWETIHPPVDTGLF